MLSEHEIALQKAWENQLSQSETSDLLSNYQPLALSKAESASDPTTITDFLKDETKRLLLLLGPSGGGLQFKSF